MGALLGICFVMVLNAVVQESIVLLARRFYAQLAGHQVDQD